MDGLASATLPTLFSDGPRVHQDDATPHKAMDYSPISCLVRHGTPAAAAARRGDKSQRFMAWLGRRGWLCLPLFELGQIPEPAAEYGIAVYMLVGAALLLPFYRCWCYPGRVID